MALTTIKTGGLADNSVTDAKVADAITITGAQTGITQVGTLTAGTWNAGVIASAYLDADTAHLSGTQTFTGAKTFTSSPLLLSASSSRLSISRTSTSGNADLSFRTNNSEADGCWTVRMGADTTPDLSFNRWTDGSSDIAVMTLNHNGNVGIGTAAPSQLLHVEAANGVSDNTWVSWMQNKESDDDRNYGLRISAGSTASDTAFFVQDHDASNDYFIIRGNGKVGIGTTSPDNKLHVSFADATAVTGANIDSDAISGIHIACTGNDTNAGGMLKFSSRGTNVVSAIAHQQMGTNTSDLVFFTGVSDGSPTEKMRIDSGGNLSLKNGTLSAEAGSGGAYATEVHTELGASSTVISYFDSLGGASWTGQIRFRTSSGGGSLGERMRLENDGTVQIYGTCSIQGITETKNIRARDNDSYDIGTSSKLYDDIYATNGTIQTSDARLKESVEDSKLGLDFLNKHRPVSYKQKGKTRRHYGLIAQEVEKVLIDSSISTEDFAPLIKDDLKDDNDVKTGENIYGMRYTEYVGILIKAVQELSAKVEVLENA